MLVMRHQPRWGANEAGHAARMQENTYTQHAARRPQATASTLHCRTAYTLPGVNPQGLDRPWGSAIPSRSLKLACQACSKQLRRHFV